MIRKGLITALTVLLSTPLQAQNLIHAFLAPPPPKVPFVAPASVGKPFPGARTRGILAFRGNPTRSWYGTRKLRVLHNLQVLWKRGPFCGLSTDQQGTRIWCGTGWTGQPVIRVDHDPVEVIFGAYDHKVHFLNAKTGADLCAPFATGDIIKGRVLLDPSGTPFLYVGSRDNHLCILWLDEGKATEVWRLSSITGDGVWNNDWDANPLVLGDYLLTGSENSWFYAIALNQGRDAKGKLGVAPKIANRIPDFTCELFRAIGNRMVSIESLALAIRDKVFFANSGGLVQVYALPKLLNGAKHEEALVMEYHTGDDVDATLVANQEGMMIYAAIEDERRIWRRRLRQDRW